ncbi:hypothetical protein [Mycobacterium servetii]|uniref:Uncharacterized protein n=1 Tax=Mycobacterium servetii TaxID=3237418 RepID=A0ABV4C9E9_9MYCO
MRYSRSDLKARRSALSLWPQDIAPLLELSTSRYKAIEAGGHGYIGAYLVGELIRMEAFVAGETERLVAAACAQGTVVLQAVPDQDTFTVRYPAAHTRRDRNPYPVSLQHVAVGRAAAELRRRGRDVAVHRGDRAFELMAARLAVGLGRTETAQLLGLNVSSYADTERGLKPPRAALTDLQAVDDFIVDTAASLKVSAQGGVHTIWIIDDQQEFENQYPQARVQRPHNNAYPIWTLRIAAARRAHTLQATTGQPVLIAVDD